MADEPIDAVLDELAAWTEADVDDEDGTDLAEDFGLPDRLPPLRLPPKSELVAAARTSPLLYRALQLASWVGSGRDLTATGELTVADAIAAAGALGIEVAMEESEEVLPGMPPKPAVRAISDLPELVRAWETAEAVDFIDSDEDRVRAGGAIGAWPDGDDDDVLAAWTTAFDYLLEEGLCVDARAYGEERLDFHPPAGDALALTLFLARGEGESRTELTEVVRDAAMAQLSSASAGKAWESWTRQHGDPAQALVAMLEEHGAVVADGDVVRLTALGSLAVCDQLVEAGIEVRVLPPVEEMTAADLVSFAEGCTPGELAEEMAAWFALRSPEVAARELLDVAASGGAAERMAATSIAGEIGASADPVWRDVLDHASLRPYAKLALSLSHEDESPTTASGFEPEAEDVAWLLTDVLAASIAEVDEESLGEQLREVVPQGNEEQIFEVMWRLPHPDVHDVLATLGKQHPDKKIAKAARKAAFRAASRRSAR